MKLVRYGAPGAEKPGVLDADGNLRDLSDIVSDIDGSTLSPAGLAKIAGAAAATLPLVRSSPRIGPCIARPLNFVCIGLNYADHAAETGATPPSEPIIFLKSLGAFQGPNDDVVIPRASTKPDWEVELGIVIGSKAKYVSEADAMNHVAGYCVVNDVSERNFQSERPGGQWDKGKSCDTFNPLGPWLATPDEIGDVHQLDMYLNVNGERRQTGNTRTMIFGCFEIVRYISQFMTLEAGDVISTGTPPGVGLGMKPPQYLKTGDVVELGIAGLGSQKQLCVACKP